MTPAAARQAGWSVIPTGRDKRPLLTTWKPYQTRPATDAEFSAWSRLNPPTWALVTGAVSHRITLDFDGAPGCETLAKLGLQPHRRTPSGGYHVDFKHPGWHVPTLNAKSKRELGERWPGLDVRADGGYACFTGQTDRGEYRWLRGPEPYELDILPADLREFLGLLKPAAPEQRTNGKPHPMTPSGRVDSERLIRAAFDRVGTYGRNNGGLWLALQLRDNRYSQAEAEGAMRNYRGRCPDTNVKGEREPYTEQEMRATLNAAYSRPAREPWEHRTAASHASRPAHHTPVTEEQPQPDPPDLLNRLFNDYGNAERVIALHGENLRFCHAFGKWLVFDGKRWAIDDGERARDLSQNAILEFARQALKAKNEGAAKFAAACLNSQRITNALREAQPHLAIRPAELDTQPDQLNFGNGTLDLKTGVLRPHRREDFITKRVHYDYRAEAKCPTFLAFLERIMANHPGLIAYLQRALGYSLTGHTSEKAVLLLHGFGDNGKTTLLALFLALLEEYAVLLQIDTLMVRQESANTQADLADLRGARFVMTSETEEGQRLAEGKIKRISQGMGRIKATRKYENPVEFPESHKLWIDANHLPVIRGTDNAIWNRLHPIPFDVTIPKAEQDRELPAKLLAEAEGILAWAVAGAVRWYADGLGKPSDVQLAGESWRAQSDHIGRFIAEACITGEYSQAKARQLYQAYKKWAEEAGEHPVTEMVFGLRITERHAKTHTKAGAVYEGIGLRAEGER